MGLEVLKTLAWEEERVRGERDNVLKVGKDGGRRGSCSGDVKVYGLIPFLALSPPGV